MKCLYAIIFALFLLPAGMPSRAMGLKFSGTPENTSLDLFSGKRLSFSGETKIEFDLKIFSAESFGQLLALDIENNPFILTLISRTGRTSPMLVFSDQNDRSHYVEIPFPDNGGDMTGWQRMRLDIRPDSSLIRISFRGKGLALHDARISDKYRMNILFGGDVTSVVETPEMAIRDITVDCGKRHMSFPLDEASGGIARQKDGRIAGKVKSPHWMIHDHYYWKKTAELKADKAAGITYDPNRDRIVIVNRDSLVSICFAGGKQVLSRQEITPSPLPAGWSGEAIYDPLRDLIYFYNLIDMENVAKPFFAEMTGTGHVNKVTPLAFNNPLHHHAYSFFPKSRGLYIFGGYGNFSYSDRIYRYNFDTGTMDETSYKGDSISSRMHVVSGVMSDTEMLIFGGVGNETGRQELGKDFYYDLYSFDTASDSLRKLWQIKETGRYVPTRNIITDPGNGCIYVFCRDRGSYAFLKRYDLLTGEAQTVSNKLFYPTDDIISSYYLFRAENGSRLYLVNRHSDNDAFSEISIFTLNAPPATLSDIREKHEDNAFPAIAAAGILLVIVFAAAMTALAVRRKKKDADEGEPEPEEEESASPAVTRNAIFFFGEFSVLDRNGTDIAGKLGPKLRQLLACIMIHSENYGGINSMKLTAAIWPEKTMGDAKSVRGATISHLRSQLKDVDGFDIIFDDSRWKIQMTDEAWCDYSEARKISAGMLAGDFSMKNASAFISIMKRGPLLPGFVQYQWFDSIKIDSEDLYFKVAEKLLTWLSENNEWKLTLKCADILFSIDKFNEMALQYKVRSLKHLGKPDLAKQIEARFRSEIKGFEQ